MTIGSSGGCWIRPIPWMRLCRIFRIISRGIIGKRLRLLGGRGRRIRGLWRLDCWDRVVRRGVVVVDLGMDLGMGMGMVVPCQGGIRIVGLRLCTELVRIIAKIEIIVRWCGILKLALVPRG